MTLEQWKVFPESGKWVAERFHALPGYTASIIRVEAESKSLLIKAVELREAQLAGTTEAPKIVITDDGTLVSDAQHSALKTAGVEVAVPDAEKVSEPVPNEDVAALEAGVDKSEAKEASPAAPADADDQKRVASAVPVDVGGSESQESPSTPSVETEATPAAIEEAKRDEIDLAKVHGTGKAGRITKADVEAAQAAASDQE